MTKLFGSGASKQVTGKAADSGYTAQKKAASQAANRETLAAAFGLSGSSNSIARDTSSALGTQFPTTQTGTQRTGTSTTGRTATGLAMDSGYTEAKADQQQQANRQAVQNWWNNEQAKSAQDNSTTRAYTAKLTGGTNIDNSADMIASLQRTFGGADDSAETQYKRTLQSKMGYGRNWGNPQSSVGNAIESGVAGVVADWLNAAGTALKSGNSRSTAGGG